MSDCPGQWKLDVNDRYQHAVGIVTSLSTAALVLPVLFLKDVAGLSANRSMADALNRWAYAGWVLLAMSILGAIIYYYSSAKWVKLAWKQPTDMFGIAVHERFVDCRESRHGHRRVDASGQFDGGTAWIFEAQSRTMPP